MPSSSERIVSTSTGDVLGSRWGRSPQPPPPPPPAHRPTPPTTPQHGPAERRTNGGDTTGSRRTAGAGAPPPEPIVSTMDEGDIIGHARRWVPTIDRPSSTPATSSPSSSSSSSTAAAANGNGNRLLRSRHAAAAAASSRNRDPAADPTSTSTSTTTTTSSSSSSSQQQRQQQLSKLKRLIDRLSWKSHTLLFTQSVALQSGEALSSSSYARPTAMFKLDFFEYYALLERVLVLFLAHFRVPLPSAACKGAGSGGMLLPISGRVGGGGGGGGGGMWGHRYHESVLEALEGARKGGEGDASALGDALGSEEVVAVLRRAKAFRNRWKDADEQEAAAPAWEWQREEVEELRLGELLVAVLRALERAYRVAEERVGVAVAGANGGGDGDGDAGGEGTWQEVGGGGLQNGYADEDMEDAPWEAVGDAMEDVMDMDVE